ncbi:MAG: glucose-1-phosphate thymidylyltransferase RfbA [Planctomycetes bacterium]|nr:glucose-1-phosphate thymidylyltransferase RfbA [Planctomycetota bacterium]
MRGIILAGGAGTRLHPCTNVVSKQLLPVYDKPMIYYPLSVLMLARIREALLISTPQDLPRFRDLLGDGSRFGMRLAYAEQPRPEGLAQAFIIGREFLAGGPACLILGDNLFYGQGLSTVVRRAASITSGAAILAYRVADPSAYGVVEFDAGGAAIGLEEKPRAPRSPYAVPGFYCYGPDVCDEAARLRPSARGEYEITDLNRRYLDRGELRVEVMGRGIAWLDTGSHQNLLQAGTFVEAIETRQGMQIACLEEIALRNGWISAAQLRTQVETMGRNGYADHLRRLLAEEMAA